MSWKKGKKGKKKKKRFNIEIKSNNFRLWRQHECGVERSAGKIKRRDNYFREYSTSLEGQAGLLINSSSANT